MGIFKAEKNEGAMPHGGLSTIKCLHHVADLTDPPHSQRQEKRATTDIKRPHLWQVSGRRCKNAAVTDGIALSPWSLMIIVVYYSL